jgi:hypothetical protein
MGIEAAAPGKTVWSALSLWSAQAVPGPRSPDPRFSRAQPTLATRHLLGCRDPGADADQALGLLCGGRNAPDRAVAAVGPTFALASRLSATR